MNEELSLILDIIKNYIDCTKLSINKDLEAEEYFGYNLNSENHTIKFRKAKITPKKSGQFVTLWKRNEEGETIPFDENDAFDFYIIFTKEETNLGFFLFPKVELSKRGILSKNLKQGKRGFRVYPEWVNVESKQADKTKVWQNRYFINLKSSYSSKLQEIFREN